MAILASELRIARKAAGDELEVKEYTCERQCDPEYIEPLDDLVANADAMVSIACSVGPQYWPPVTPFSGFIPASTPPASAGPWNTASGKATRTAAVTAPNAPNTRGADALFESEVE